MPSKLWNFFKKGFEVAICNRCSASIPTKRGNTAGLRSHLKFKHTKDDYLILIELVDLRSDVVPTVFRIWLCCTWKTFTVNSFLTTLKRLYNSWTFFAAISKYRIIVRYRYRINIDIALKYRYRYRTISISHKKFNIDIAQYRYRIENLISISISQIGIISISRHV